MSWNVKKLIVFLWRDEELILGRGGGGGMGREGKLKALEGSQRLKYQLINTI